jgi:hypothetical protein
MGLDMWLTLTMVTVQVSETWVSMGGLKCPNEFKAPRSQLPDYHVFGEPHPEVGGARNRTRKTSAKSLCLLLALFIPILSFLNCALILNEMSAAKPMYLPVFGIQKPRLICIKTDALGFQPSGLFGSFALHLPVALIHKLP